MRVYKILTENKAKTKEVSKINEEQYLYSLMVHPKLKYVGKVIDNENSSVNNDFAL